MSTQPAHQDNWWKDNPGAFGIFGGLVAVMIALGVYLLWRKDKPFWPWKEDKDADPTATPSRSPGELSPGGKGPSHWRTTDPDAEKRRVHSDAILPQRRSAFIASHGKARKSVFSRVFQSHRTSTASSELSLPYWDLSRLSGLSDRSSVAVTVPPPAAQSTQRVRQNDASSSSPPISEWQPSGMGNVVPPAQPFPPGPSAQSLSPPETTYLQPTPRLAVPPHSAARPSLANNQRRSTSSIQRNAPSPLRHSYVESEQDNLAVNEHGALVAGTMEGLTPDYTSRTNTPMTTYSSASSHYRMDGGTHASHSIPTGSETPDLVAAIPLRPLTQNHSVIGPRGTPVPERTALGGVSTPRSPPQNLGHWSMHSQSQDSESASWRSSTNMLSFHPSEGQDGLAPPRSHSEMLRPISDISVYSTDDATPRSSNTFAVPGVGMGPSANRRGPDSVTSSVAGAGSA